MNQASRYFATLSLLLLTFSATFAQVTAESTVKGNLGGVVDDSSGAVIAAATIKVRGPTGDRILESDAQGAFLIPLLTPGFYTVRIEKRCRN